MENFACAEQIRMLDFSYDPLELAEFLNADECDVMDLDYHFLP